MSRGICQWCYRPEHRGPCVPADWERRKRASQWELLQVGLITVAPSLVAIGVLALVYLLRK